MIVALAGLTALVTAGCADDLPDVPTVADAPNGGVQDGAGQDGAGQDGAVQDGGGQDGGAGGVAFNGVTVTVQALDNSFRLQNLVVEAGTEVVFDNVGRNEHNVIPEPDSIQGWGVGEDAFAPGDVYAHVFTDPGVYAYVCTIHGVNGKGMVGTVTVEAAN